MVSRFSPQSSTTETLPFFDQRPRGPGALVSEASPVTLEGLPHVLFLWHGHASPPGLISRKDMPKKILERRNSDTHGTIL
jgi:hypothetical protein